LVVIAIIALLLSILLPSLSRAKESARASSCAANLRAFGSAFQLYASDDPYGAMCSGAFDHLRDGDIRSFGWVADVINLKVGSPGAMLCPSNPYRVNEKVADYTGAATTGHYSPLRWPDGPNVPVVPVGPESKELWAKGYNTNYATTWHFSRGDPVDPNGYGVNGNPSDPSKCPGDGDGPLNEKHLSQCAVSVDRVALMGDSRAGDSADSTIDSNYARTINEFAGEEVAKVGEYTVESFTDGMTVDYSTVTGRTGQYGHEFNDIWPLHATKSGGVGGYANVLFADGHVSAVRDSGGLNNKPDAWLGPYKNAQGKFEINASAFDEIRKLMWYGRLRGRALPGGGSIE